ncbi:hypothetical protein ACTNE0_02255 [Bacillota bacterium HCP3S3_E9]
MSPVAIFDKDSGAILYILTFLRVFLKIPAANKGFERQQIPGVTRQPEKSICIGTSCFFCYTEGSCIVQFISVNAAWQSAAVTS